MTFRPTLWMTVFVAVGLVVLVGLGTWQLDRRVWKEDILELRAQRITAPVRTYSEVVDAASEGLDAVEYGPIQLQGRYRPDADIKLQSRTRGGRAGFHIITPLVLETDGAVVLVDRGWAPVGSEDEVAPAPAGVVSVEGYVRRFETPGRFTPDNDPDTGTWFYVDRDQMASATGVRSVAPFYVQQAPKTAASGIYPAGGVPDIALSNPHLQYAMTWYALAVVLLVIYVVFQARRKVGGDE